MEYSGTPRAGPTRFTSPLAVQSDLSLSSRILSLFSGKPWKDETSTLRGGRLVLEVVSVLQRGLGQPRILGRNCNGRSPVAPAFDQIANPTAESVLLVSQIGHHCAGSEYQQASQVAVPRLGDAA